MSRLQEIHVFWGQRKGQIGKLCSVKVGGLGRPQALGVGWERTQDPKREGGGRAARFNSGLV